MIDINHKVIINSIEYKIVKLIGHGKGGYSYLGIRDNDDKFYVIKAIHHEPCDYYQFSNKIESELRDYQTLKNTGINIPKMIDYDKNQEIIIKEYIDGKTIDQLIIEDKMKDCYIEQIKKMCAILYPLNLNIDYFPTNFVVSNEILYYIDFECNPYSEKWNFENWGIKYWSKTEDFKSHFKI